MQKNGNFSLHTSRESEIWTCEQQQKKTMESDDDTWDTTTIISSKRLLHRHFFLSLFFLFPSSNRRYDDECLWTWNSYHHIAQIANSVSSLLLFVCCSSRRVDACTVKISSLTWAHTLQLERNSTIYALLSPRLESVCIWMTTPRDCVVSR